MVAAARRHHRHRNPILPLLFRFRNPTTPPPAQIVSTFSEFHIPKKHAAIKKKKQPRAGATRAAWCSCAERHPVDRQQLLLPRFLVSFRRGGSAHTTSCCSRSSRHPQHQPRCAGCLCPCPSATEASNPAHPPIPPSSSKVGAGSAHLDPCEWDWPHGVAAGIPYF